MLIAVLLMSVSCVPDENSNIQSTSDTLADTEPEDDTAENSIVIAESEFSKYTVIYPTKRTGEEGALAFDIAMLLNKKFKANF